MPHARAGTGTGTGTATKMIVKTRRLSAAVYEAAGMISVRPECSLDDALAMIRARAFAEDRDVYAVADSILRGTENLL
jgi:hypothetical protein